jgi:hypothetical protein
MPILWHKASASYIMCVVKKRARLSWHLAKTYHICRLLSGSSPVEGSSKKTILGSPTKLIAMESLRFMPPESAEERKSLKVVKLTSPMAVATFASSYSPGIPLSLA